MNHIYLESFYITKTACFKGFEAITLATVFPESLLERPIVTRSNMLQNATLSEGQKPL